jgi:hypothetical protein
MTPDEWEQWQTFNLMLHPRDRAESPCVDCTPEFAATQQGICDGVPGEDLPPAEDRERAGRREPRAAA